MIEICGYGSKKTTVNKTASSSNNTYFEHHAVFP